MVVFYGGFYLFWYGLSRKSSIWPIYCLAGLLIGFAMLFRPIAIGLGAVLAAILWLVGRGTSVRYRLFLITILLLGNLTAIFPWQVWVYSNTGKVILLSTHGVQTILDGLTYAVTHKEYRIGGAPEDVEALMQNILAREAEMASLHGVVSVMIEEFRMRPMSVAKLLLLKAVRSWYGTNSMRFETPIIFIQIIYLVLILWSSRAAWKQGNIKRELIVSVYLVILYFWAMTILALSILRYMAPVIGLLFVLIPGSFFRRMSYSSKTIGSEDAWRSVSMLTGEFSQDVSRAPGLFLAQYPEGS
jgi:hypothetical protein